MDETVRNALLQFEDACSASGHSLCGNDRTCEAGLSAVSHWRSERERALRFDVGRWAITKRMELPEHDWSTPTLLVVARNALESQPNIDSLKRATIITTALARLGERGLPADCVVRTCMGAKLLRRIILAAANVWCDIRSGLVDRTDVPELEGWLQAIDVDEQEEKSRPEDRARVVLRSLRGQPRVLGEQWLRSAAVTHIIGWRLDGYLISDVRLDDLTLPGGEQASRWVYERFTETYPEDWTQESLNWEAAFRTFPREIADQVGLGLERPSRTHRDGGATRAGAA